MAIKRKDGSIYKLRGPNPIMRDQSFWDDDFVVHNWFFPEVVIQEGIQAKEVKKEIPKEIIYCLPAIITKHYDELYDETKTIVKYGDKFTFEGITVEKGDISSRFWTTDKNITESSILYSQKRWWKVSQTEDYNNGILITCLPSDLQPSFE